MTIITSGLYTDAMMLIPFHKIKLLVIFLALTCPFSSELVANEKSGHHIVQTAITESGLKFVAERLELSDATIVGPDTCPNLNSSILNNSIHEFIELSIICNALFSTDIAHAIQLVPFTSHTRKLNEIARNHLDLAADFIYPEGKSNLLFGAELLLSNPLMGTNKIKKGVFTLPERTDVLAAESITDLQGFVGLTSSKWQVDKKTLLGMQLRDVVYSKEPQFFTRMLMAKRADFTILSFNQPKNKEWAKELVIVPNIEIGLASYPSIPIAPEREDLQQVINQYLSENQLAILKAYALSGFNSANWD